MSDLSIIIPCYNETKNLSRLFNKIDSLIEENQKIELIIVDNGSIDNSRTFIENHNLFKNNKIKLVKIDNNIGYGHGIMQGIYKSTGKVVSWCHADLQTDLRDTYEAYLNNKIQLLEKNIIVKGKRLKRSFLDSFFTGSMSLISSLIFRKVLFDINAQPKVFSRKFIKLMNDPPNDFSLDLYLIVLAKINNYEIINYPVITKNRIAGIAKGGGSLKGKLKLTLRTFKYIFELKNKIYGNNRSQN